MRLPIARLRVLRRLMLPVQTGILPVVAGLAVITAGATLAAAPLSSSPSSRSQNISPAAVPARTGFTAQPSIAQPSGPQTATVPTAIAPPSAPGCAPLPAPAPLPATAPLMNKSAKASQVPMKSEKIRALIERARKARVQGRADEFANLFALDGQLIIPGATWVGRSAIRQATALGNPTSSVGPTPQRALEIRQVLIEGNRAVVEWRWENVEPNGQRQLALEEAIAIEFRNGYITRWREYTDNPAIALTPTARPKR